MKISTLIRILTAAQSALTQDVEVHFEVQPDELVRITGVRTSQDDELSVIQVVIL